MIAIRLKGTPESVAEAINTLISSGNTISKFQTTRNAATYFVLYDNSGPMPDSFLLMEDGSYLLLETNDKIILE